MKTTFSFWIVMLISIKSFGLNDFERGILFYSNMYSYGTFIADMEGRMAQIRLEYEKRKAELKYNFEANRRTSQIAQIKSDITFNNDIIQNLSNEKKEIEKKLLSFSTVVKYAQGMFEDSVAREILKREIEEHAKEDEAFRKDWEQVLSDSDAVSSNMTSSEKHEMVFSTALEAQARIETLQSSIQSQIEEVDSENNALAARLKALQ